MPAGFLITCLQCGEQYQVVPGRRSYRREQIVFGTDNYGADQMSCECGNAMEEHSHFEGGAAPHEGEFVVHWRSLAK